METQSYTLKKILIVTGSALTLYGSGLASAQSIAATLPHHNVVASEVNLELMGDELDKPLAAALEKRLISKKFNRKVEAELGISGQKIIRRAYAQCVFKPIWTRAGAASLRDATQNLYHHGIVTNTEDLERLDKLIAQRFDVEKSAKVRAKADTKLTLIFMRKAKLMAGGLHDEGGSDQPDIDGPMRANLTQALINSGKGHSFVELEAFAPSHQQYGALKSALQRYRTLQNEGGWLAIPEGDIVEVGDTDPRIPAIKARLAVENFYTPLRTYSEISPDEYTVQLETALKAFQKRHALADDGVIGNNTLAALNESVASKIDKIADSMHRWRVQGDMGKRHIWANIPSYTAIGMNNGEREIEMRTVVGKPRFATQVFSDRVEYMVANPKWYLPVSITRRQKVPKLRRDASYAQQYGYQIFDRKTGEQMDAAEIDWTEPGVARQYRFVQEAGPGNALGKLKIIFPNQYSIYLHGTPSKSLFEKSQRAFSSGCVRLEDPVAMAEWIAKDDSRLTPERVEAASESGENTRLVLEEQVPVHITYYLVTANEDGSVNFLRDVYDRDDGIQMVEKQAKLYRPKIVQSRPDKTAAP